MKNQRLSIKNRNLTFKEVLGIMSKKRKAVYDVISKYPQGIIAKDVAKILGWEINKVVGRITELHDTGFITQVSTVRCPITNKPNTLYSAIENPVRFEVSHNFAFTKKQLRKAKKIFKLIDDNFNASPDKKMFDYEIVQKIAKLL